MVNLMRRHAKVIFVAVTVVVAITFVFWGAPGGGGRAGGRSESLRLFGRQVSADEIHAARQAIQLRSILFNQRSELNDQEFREQIAIRLLMLRQARALHLHVTNEQVGQLEAELTRAQPLKGEDPVMLQERQKHHYDEVIQHLAANGIAATDFDRILREDLVLEQLQRLILISTHATPAELQQWWEFAHEKMTVSIARFKASDYLERAVLTNDEAKKFYESDPSPFALPEKIKVRYVRFDLESAKKTASSSEEELRAAYERQKNLFLDDKGQPKPFETVRTDLESKIRTSKAFQELGRRAQKMIQELSPSPQGGKTVSFSDAATARGLTVVETDFFALQDAVPGVRAGRNFNSEAFKLRDNFRIGNPVVGEDGIYVMEFIERQPRNEKPDFAKVKDRVLAFAREVRAHELAQKAGLEALGKILAAIQQGDTFAHACAAQGVPAISLPPFALVDSLPDVADENAIKSSAVNLNPGQTSEWVGTAEGGFILHLDLRQPADTEPLKKTRSTELAKLQNIKQQLVFQEWLAHLVKQSGLSVP